MDFFLKAYFDSKAHGKLTAGALAFGKNTLAIVFFVGFSTDKLSPECTSITVPMYDFSLSIWDLVTCCYFQSPFPL